jgi:15-cis-phytoene synthase
MRREAGGDLRSLERTFRERAAPAGSPRYFALLFAAEDLRAPLAALYAFEAEVRAAVHPDTEHAAAHLKLAWWAEETERMVRGAPLHPIGRALWTAARAVNVDLSCLSETLAAAHHDLAARPISDQEELMAYCHRSGGLAQQFAASLAQPSADRLGEVRRFGGALGRGLRLTELLRGHAADLRAGRVRLPQVLLRKHGVTPEQFLTPPQPPAAIALLDELAAAATVLLTEAVSQPLSDRSRQRAGLVLAELALVSLRRMRTARFAPGSLDHPPAATMLWHAWRTARKA